MKRKRCEVQQAIAILDSGVGGLTVVKEVIRQLPQERIIYFGDTARTPYGPRSSAEVLLFTMQIVGFLVRYQPKMVVIACNTATAVALETIRDQIDMPVIGVIHPGARAAIKKTKSKIVGVIGTEGTIRSQAYDQVLNRISPDIQVHSQACPQLVPLVEQGQFNSSHTRMVVSDSLNPLKVAAVGESSLDCLILGCTHYPFLSKAISEVMGPQVQLVNSAEETAREISAILHERGQLAKLNHKIDHLFFCSGNLGVFQRIARKWLCRRVRVISARWNGSLCMEMK